MTRELARNKPSKRELARWRDLLLLTRSSAEMYFLNGAVQRDRGGGGMLCGPEGGHPSFKIGGVKTSDVERSIA
jgi:hypothetical protein